MTVDEKIKQLKMHEQEISKLEYLKRIYPDLEIIKDRWDKEYYTSEEVNKRAQHYHTWHSCGCCPDSPLYINPYIKEGDIYIYAKPFNICIGEKNIYGCGDILYTDWPEILRKYNINETIINKVAKGWKEECNQN